MKREQRIAELVLPLALGVNLLPLLLRKASVSTQLTRLGETKDITLALASGNFQIVTLKIYDITGAERYRFAPGETVRYNGVLKNVGDAPSYFYVQVIDVDTGEPLGYFNGEAIIPVGAEAPIGEPVNNIPVFILVGTMPNRTWHLRFIFTP